MLAPSEGDMNNRFSAGHSRPAGVTRHSLPASLLRSIAERFDADGAVNALMTATAGDMYLFGGAIRRTVLGDRLSGDLDIMVPKAMTAPSPSWLRSRFRRH